MYVAPERECVLLLWHVGKSRQCTSQPAKKVSLGNGAKRGVSRSFCPNDHSWMDRASNLAVHGPGLSINHENGFVSCSDQVGAKHPCAGDGAVRVTPFRSTRIHRSPDACDHFDLPVGQVDEQDVLFGRRAGVQVVVMCCTRWEKCDVSNL